MMSWMPSEVLVSLNRACLALSAAHILVCMHGAARSYDLCGITIGVANVCEAMALDQCIYDGE